MRFIKYDNTCVFKCFINCFVSKGVNFMREIGGYIELDTYRGKMLHDGGIKLNCGRCALDYVIRTKKIKKIYVPKFMCNSNDLVLRKNSVETKYYSIGKDFKPIIEKRQADEWLYLVNYYGQLSNEYIKTLGNNIIVDNAHAYFQKNIEGYITIYNCRKFFGVADGAILYSDEYLEELEQDISFDRMHFLLGRYEKTASEFYPEYIVNNDLFEREPIKKMSKLTENLLHGIDYDFVKERRTENFSYLHEKLKDINQLSLDIPDGAFMYPLYIENGAEIRNKLQQIKIYIPTLWSDVFEICREDELEYDMAKNILPLPIDQRYTRYDMDYIINSIFNIAIK